MSLENMRRVLAGETETCSTEMRYLRAAGSHVWVCETWSLVRESSRTPKYFISVLEDVTARKQAEAALKTYATQLERSNRELGDFAFIASHDLQEPLRKIQALGERLTTNCGAVLGQEGHDYLDRMTSAAARLESMINDLLTYARVASSAQSFVPVDLSQVAQEVVSDLEVRIAQSGGRVEVGELPSLDADPLQMRQLLQNLIGNALKFHAPDAPPVVKVHGARLQATGANGGELWQVIVEDNGIGFEEQYLERIFAPFQRLQGRSQYEGAGLGLAICRKIVERHGGSITARSAPGQGARFIVNLPANRTPDLDGARETGGEQTGHS
jgi:light-regulated signal transduction histidine kinase (bacteriophytochrome)